VIDSLLIFSDYIMYMSYKIITRSARIAGGVGAWWAPSERQQRRLKGPKHTKPNAISALSPWRISKLRHFGKLFRSKFRNCMPGIQKTRSNLT
jgi:hypothetical protein